MARLTKIPGVGKKTAERIGLELKDRLPEIPEAPNGIARWKTNDGAIYCQRW